MVDKLSAVRNPDGWFINSSVFSEEANHFRKYGYFTEAAWGSPDWVSYWTEQLYRWQYGYSVGGVKITGPQYSYLNFSPIMRSAPGERRKHERGKRADFPDFWDYDYNYYHSLHIARYGCTEDELERLKLEVKPLSLRGDHHLCVAKARRKGYSFKNGSLIVNHLNVFRNILCLLNAYESKYLFPSGTMSMVDNYLTFLNQHTGLGKKREWIDKQAHKKLSYKELINGTPVEKGYKSEVMCLTFKDNIDASRGKDPFLVLWEEGGAFDNLEHSFLVTKPAVEDGIYTTGQMIVQGTGGDMEKGSRDFNTLFYNPLKYNFLPFDNIWDKGASGTFCSFFVPTSRNLVGFIDENGNSLVSEALESQDKIKKELQESKGGASAYNKYIQEFPESPEEAFLQSADNPFPTEVLRKVRSKLERGELYKIIGKPVHLYYDEGGKVGYKIDLEGKLNAVYRYPHSGGSTSSSLVMYEAPPETPPPGMFIIGYDQLQQDLGTSLASFFVYKTTLEGTSTHSTIVAEYCGREETTEEVNSILLKTSILYNAEIMHENMSKDCIVYFKNKNKSRILMSQPDSVIEASIRKSKVKRRQGIHMTTALFNDGLKYMINHLLQVHHVEEDDTEVLNMELIPSIGLLDEMIGYDKRKGNYDRLIAYMMVIFALKEEELVGIKPDDNFYEELSKFYERKIALNQRVNDTAYGFAGIQG